MMAILFILFYFYLYNVCKHSCLEFDPYFHNSISQIYKSDTWICIHFRHLYLSLSNIVFVLHRSGTPYL